MEPDQEKYGANPSDSQQGDMRDEDSNRLAISYNQTLDAEKSAEQPSVASNTSNQPPSQITFDGLDDPENPHNWGIWKKAYTTSIPGLMGLAAMFGSSVYSPSYAEVAERFQVSNTVALLPITLYTYGLACGPVIAAPLSETYGRRFIYIFCMSLSLMSTLGAGFSQNLASLLICRLLAGILGSPPLAVGAGTNLDIWAPIHRARTAKIILAKRLKKLGKPLPPSPIPEGIPAIKFLLTVTLARPIHMILTEPIVGLYSLYVGFNFSVLFCFFAAFPLVFRGLYKFSVGEAGLVFLGLSAGCAAAAAIFPVIDDFAYIRRVLRNRAAGGDGTIAPENRLYGAMLESVLLTVGLFWFAWTARADIHWISCVIATVFFACGNLLTFTSCALYLTDVYGPLNGASAMAANGIVRYMLGGSFPLFTVQMYEKLGIDWATSLLAFVSLALLPVPWLFFRYGSLIRKKSGYDVAYP
ncbi:hypothetical protein DTO271G3_4001 [Paecilomyces variotii]|nr:hypothetical protein DTO271G3_4001 [Paecilomyces variotii]